MLAYGIENTRHHYDSTHCIDGDLHNRKNKNRNGLLHQSGYFVLGSCQLLLDDM